MPLSSNSPAADQGNRYNLTPLLFPQMVGTRRREILLAAASLFAEKGYKGASIRVVADRIGITAGSLYHHIESKEALFLEVHGEALRVAGDCLDSAVLGASDPWDRLSRACRTLLEIQLHPQSITLPLMEDLSQVSPPLRARLIVQRDTFEGRFREWIEALPLSPDIDLSVYRLTLLTLLNSTVRWYRPGGLSPSQIADQIIRIYLHP